MKYIDLIGYLIDPEKLENLYKEIEFDSESEVLLIYMEDSLRIDSEISIFKIEETDDDLVFEKGGVKYYQLFPVDYAVELIETDLNLKNQGYSIKKIAQSLLDYKLNDA